MGATNEPWNLDPAILRPGRFDERVYIGLPDEAARKQIFEMNLKGRPLADDADLAELAKRSDGLSGADVKNICEKAAADAFLRAVRDTNAKPPSESPPISKQDLLTALEAVRPSVSRDDLERFLRYRERPE
jgi:SpoVK/Ycf46/Vps4 family AAA+-type ATPase